MSEFRITENRLGGGAVEIGIRNKENQLAYVVTHPCKGAKWFLYGFGFAEKRKFATKKAAIEKAISELSLD